VKSEVKLFSDGACSGNPGPGGWACVLVFGELQRVLSGYEAQTTNNRMELLGVIGGLKVLQRPCYVDITTDSQYVKNAFTEGWLNNWIRNGWVTKSKSPVKNQDLWQELCYLQRQHELQWHWVKGHSGHHYNDMCDEYARKAIVQKAGVDLRENLEGQK
jgi:ribonuclease HI